MLVAAFVRGAPARVWWEESIAKGVDVWAVGHDVISDPRAAEAAKNVLELLVELGDEKAVALMAESLDEPTLAPTGFDALARAGTARAVRVLAAALADDAKVPGAIEALRRMGTPDAIEVLSSLLRNGGPTGLRAGTALDKLAREPAGFGRADAAVAALQSVLEERAGALFEDALRSDVPARFWFEQAQKRGIRVWETIRRLMTDPQAPLAQAEAAVRLLHELEDPAARELLDLAAAQPRLQGAAERARETRDELEQVRGERAEAATRARATRSVQPGIDAVPWRMIIQRIQEDACVPILGPGMSAGIVPAAAEIARSLAYRHDLRLHDEHDLARVSEALESIYDAALVRDEVAEIVRADIADSSDPTEPHAVLAQLPLSLYLSANFDGLLGSALTANMRHPIADVVNIRSRRSERVADDLPGPSQAGPLVVHLYGHASAPESLVLTNDDFLDLTWQLGQDMARIIRPSVLAKLKRSMLLVLGMPPQGQPWRVIRRWLLSDNSSALPLGFNLGRLATAGSSGEKGHRKPGGPGPLPHLLGDGARLHRRASQAMDVLSVTAVGFQKSATGADLGFLHGPLVLVDQATEDRPTLDPLPGKVDDRVVGPGRAELAAAMGTPTVVMALVLCVPRISSVAVTCSVALWGSRTQPPVLTWASIRLVHIRE